MKHEAESESYTTWNYRNLRVCLKDCNSHCLASSFCSYYLCKLGAWIACTNRTFRKISMWCAKCAGKIYHGNHHYENKKVQHRSWHTAKCNKLYHLKWNINAWGTAIPLHGRHFVRHLGICNPICIKLLQLMSGVITHNSVKKRSLILISGWVTAKYSVHGRHFARHFGICNQICVKLLQVMSGVIPRNLKETTSLSQTVFPGSTTAAYTHARTHERTHARTHERTHTHRQTHIHTRR